MLLPGANTLGELVFIGLGLNDEKGISLKGLAEAKTADQVFLELYTSLMPEFSLKKLTTLIDKKIHVVRRCHLEEENGSLILNAAEKGKVVFLVPGDPFIATTHMAMRLEAVKRGIKTSIVHGPSILSAIVSLSGLHNYKFGKTVTIPFSENSSETPYYVIAQNRENGLHTLCLLDLKVEENRSLRVKEGLQLLLEIERKKRKRVVTPKTLAIGAARVGSDEPTLKADYVRDLINFDFGEPPHSLIFPGQLHFMEVEALVILAGAPKKLRRLVK